MAGPPGAPVRLALDANFPRPILQSLRGPLLAIGLDLIPLEHVDPRLNEVEDWRLILAVAQHGMAALVGNDARMPDEPRVLPAIRATKISLVVIEAMGHDPVRATGALLLDLPAIVKKLSPTSPAIFRVRHAAPTPIPARDAIADRARRLGETAEALLRREKITSQELANPFHGWSAGAN